MTSWRSRKKSNPTGSATAWAKARRKAARMVSDSQQPLVVQQRHAHVPSRCLPASKVRAQ